MSGRAGNDRQRNVRIGLDDARNRLRRHSGHVIVDEEKIEPSARRPGANFEFVQRCDLVNRRIRIHPRQLGRHRFAIEWMIVGNENAHFAPGAGYRAR